MCKAESITNSRPLIYLPEDTKDLIAFTPVMLIQEIKEVGMPDLHRMDSKRINKRFMCRQKLRQDLKRRFRNEYFDQLREFLRLEKEVKIKEGNIGLIGDSNTIRLNWSL
ncbi:reverse transcriptase [Caerostris darwini]|uniref:Reverse transcriptase n=1 Tax=Caerostris darwini TaxID=1538125 RepID=A0AAV4TFS2_9ARAC|nr:reverse transcriptase [Caerostris darwini]